MSEWEANEEIKIFREYLRIPSVHPNINYDACVKFLKAQSVNLGLDFKVYTPGGVDKPIVVLTWKGLEPQLPAIMLNSHMDVVPVYEERWTHPPFAADMDEEGRIFARGSQDMKCVGMQHLAAIRALKKAGVTLKRTIHVTFVPDEETGGVLGMRKFAFTDDFKKLNIGFSLDEGIASADNGYLVYYAERSIWHVHFKMTGTTGHGSLLHENTVGSKLNYLLNKLMEFRQQQVDRLNNDPTLTIGDVTTINLTQIKSGVQNNVVPSTLEAGFDMRLAITLNHAEFEAQLRKWCDEAGGGIEIEYEQKENQIEPTKLDASNFYWTAFNEALDECGIERKVLVFPGGTDSRYIREVGIPAIGFSPINNTPVLLHDNDEFLKADTYIHGIEVYKTLLNKIGNI